MTRTGNTASDNSKVKAESQNKRTYEIGKVLSTSRVNWRIDEFCIAHRISRAHFYREVKAGRLSYFKTGSLSLVPRSVADNWQNTRLSEAADK